MAKKRKNVAKKKAGKGAGIGIGITLLIVAGAVLCYFFIPGAKDAINGLFTK